MSQKSSPNLADVSSDSESQSVAARLLSLDAYRGAIMISLAFGGFGLAETANRHLKSNGESRIWSFIAYQFEHVDWLGCSYWDLIQPSFMFMVGVSMAYSYVKREQSGQSYRWMLVHAIVRAVVLVLLGVFLSSNGSKATNWSFMNVLSQIGLGYTFLFLLWRRGFLVQIAAVLLLLFGTWLGYTAFPGAGIDIEQGNPDVGISSEWAKANLLNIDPAWHKNANVGQAADLQFLNSFPRLSPYEFNSGGYQTINFIPSLATMILGLICGECLRSRMTDSRKLISIFALGAASIAIGWALSTVGSVPLIKRIWTPSWALFSAGICSMLLASLFGIIDVLRFKWWAYPLVVVGTNSIAVYLMSQMLKPWMGRSLQTHMGQDLFMILGENWEPLVRSNCIGLGFWLVCLWLYKQRIFLRI